MRQGVLFVSSRPEEAAALLRILNSLSIPLEHNLNLKQARRTIREQGCALVLTAAELPDGTWHDVLRVVEETGKRLPVLVTHPFADERMWVDVLDSGALDLLPQPFQRGEVCRIIRDAISRELEIAAPAGV